ncbi:MAG: DUF6089 family protein [Bacteroidia bacterium]|jgi:hypothetical protein|nr:DUF6089 family protein [Bacteroidia bacterium]
MGAKFKQLAAVAFLSLIMSVSQSDAQNIEFGVFAGASNYMGDVGGQKLHFDQTHFSAAFIGRYNISSKVAVKGFIGYGRVSGADSLSNDPKVKIRNMNFFSDIYEFSAHLEYNLVRYNVRGRSGNPLVPYLFGGIGIFHYNPKTNFLGDVYELQPLGTEGQGTTQYNELKKYDLTTVCIPMGIGFKKKVSPSFVVGLELGMRFTFTNYLDDVGGVYANATVVERAYGPVAGRLSNRTAEVAGNIDGGIIAREGEKRTTPPALINTDMYFMAGISISYVLQNIGQPCPKF